eukprot:TRINITY_DN10565_c0_g1_i2.p1 TRINITY_DN10565_c0_g1~~TRINITY_DN10565_c0_g1_i2.p1  ORF type:complete len:406 (+),score=126.46 TRINITY_DN10565_c0_g1_i2:48-1220(+)
MARVLGGMAAVGVGAYLLPAKYKYPVHSWVADRLTDGLRNLDAELAHNLAIEAAKWKLTPVAPPTDPALYTRVCGLGFESPVGLAAGFDKNAEAIEGLFNLGFGFVEVGTITPVGQIGNPRPRMFRLEEDLGVINRYGFNNEGVEAVLPRVKTAERHSKPLGINVGKNKVTPEAEAVSDYVKTIEALGPYADYLVINVSSPNTPGLRDLQKRDILEGLLKSVLKTRDELTHKPPLFVKIAPDIDAAQLKDIAAASMNSKVDGVIVSNTTISRPAHLINENKKEAGGLSGAPVRALSTRTIYEMSKATNGKLPIIGVGGIANGRDAFDKILVGASLVQIYSMMAYEGPSIAHRTNTELVQLLKSHGFNSVSDAVGAAHRNPSLLPSDLKTK